MLTVKDNTTYITNRWYEIGISKLARRIQETFYTFESAANKILELETQQEGKSYQDKFFVIEIQTMIVKDENGDIIFSNQIERKV